MPISDTVLDALASFLLDMPRPRPGDAKLGGRVIARLMTSQKLHRHEQIVEWLKNLELQYMRAMRLYWRSRARRAERRLMGVEAQLEHLRGLNTRATARRLNAVHGVGGWQVEALTDASDEA